MSAPPLGLRTTLALLPDVERAQRRLRSILLLRALVAGIGAGLATWLVLTLTAQPMAASAAPSPAIAAVVAALVAIAVAALLVRRTRGVDAVRAALWVEAHAPTGFAAVLHTEEAAHGTHALSPDLGTALAASAQRAIAAHREPLQRAERAAARRQLVGPTLFLAGAVALAVLVQARPRLVTATSGIAVDARGNELTPGATPIGAWRVRVVPPAYTGLAATSAGDADGVRAIAGSRIEISAGGDPPSVSVRVVGDSGARSGASPRATVATDDRGWAATIAVPAAPLEVRIARGGATRLLLVESFADSIPRVSLRLPARDSVLRQATGRLPLQATLHDDLGLANGGFELIVSSGEGERFTARTVSIGASRLGGQRDRTLDASLDVAALGLGPGDVVHLRAIARDAHPGSTREPGSSETRSFRIARPSEYDSVAVEPAPPPAVDSSLLSQRMLLMLTERLERRRPRLARPTLVSESGRLARDQARLRLAVGSAVFQRLSGEGSAEHAHTVGDGHDHGVDEIGGKLALPGRDANGVLDEGDDSPVIAINRPLLEAYNAMWDAGRALEQADTRGAIPHMRLALAAIERARSASRLYLRGKPPTVIVDLAKVRLTGKDTGRTNVRSAREALSLQDAARERRLLAAASLLTRDATSARDSLALLRLELVGDAPLLADALSAVLDALRDGRDATPALLRARRALGGVERLPDGTWSRGGPP